MRRRRMIHMLMRVAMTLMMILTILMAIWMIVLTMIHLLMRTHHLMKTTTRTMHLLVTMAHPFIRIIYYPLHRHQRLRDVAANESMMLNSIQH